MKLSDIVNKFIPDTVPTENIEALSRLNPDKIYLENVRSLLNISHRRAKIFCDTAVRQGAFESWIEVRCNESVVATAKTEVDLPKTVRCWIERDGESEPVFMKSADLPKVPFYRLIG